MRVSSSGHIDKFESLSGADKRSNIHQDLTMADEVNIYSLIIG